MNVERKRSSIGSRLITAHALSLTLILILFSTVVAFLFWKNLEHGLHRELGLEFEVIEGLIDKAAPSPLSLSESQTHEEAEYEGEAIAAEIWASKTQRLARTVAAQRLKLPDNEMTGSWDEGGFALIESESGKVHVLQGLHESGGKTYLIRIFRSARAIDQAMSTLIWTILAGLLVALGLALLSSQRLVRKVFLEPLAQMAEAAAHISEERSGAAVLPIANPGDELGHLGTVFNDVLRRYDLAISRARRFSADASHELRTPLTSIRSVGEVALHNESSIEGYRDAIGSMLEDVDGITGMLDSLMLLSRADEGKVPLSREAVNVHELIFSLCEDMNVLSDPKGQTLTIHGDDGLVAQLDARVLRLALINLVDNAIKFAPRGSEIEITTRLAIDELQIEVHNPGEGIAAEHRDAIFDRFYRVDLGRSRSAGGSGLGLSVARWAVEAHQGTISLVDGPNGVTAGATFRIALPFGPLKTA